MYNIVDKDGISREFKTKKEIADFMIIPLATLYSRLRKMTCQEAYDFYFKIKIYKIIDKDGISREFKTRKEMSDFTNIKYHALGARLQVMTPQEAYDFELNKKIYNIIDKDGIPREFHKLTEIAEFIGVKPATLTHRLQRMALQEIYDFELNRETYKIIDKCGVQREFKYAKGMSDFMKIPLGTLTARLQKMTSQEAYDYDCKYNAFGKKYSALSYFTKTFKISELGKMFNKYNKIMSLEEIIILAKLNKLKPEVCVNKINGEFQLLSEFCEEKDLDFSFTLGKLKKNGGDVEKL